MAYFEHLLSLRVWNFSMHWVEGCLCIHDQNLIKPLDTEYLMSFPVDNISQALSQLTAGGIQHLHTGIKPV